MTSCISCGIPLVTDDEHNSGFCLLCLDKIDSDCQKIAKKWKELDARYREGLEKILKQYCIEVFDNDEGIRVEFFFRGRYINAYLEWSGDVSDYDYLESLENIWDSYKERLSDIARACSNLISGHSDEIEEACQSLGYEFDWDECMCWYRNDKYSLTSSSYQTDWSLIEVEE